MPTSTVENYIKQIYLAQQDMDTPLLPMGQLASAMKVSPGTATAMVKTLADSGLIEYEPRGGIRLTPHGEKLALHILRRHRLVELFLVDVLGLDWSEVHEEADMLEHALSDKVMERMDVLLKHPQFDPHGDPIPSAKGRIKPLAAIPLSEGIAGKTYIVARIADQDAAFLQFANRTGLVPGVETTLTGRDREADSISIRIAKRKITLGNRAAGKIMVREA
jgi:DtxR family Mn-dependent transcriptional regulator